MQLVKWTYRVFERGSFEKFSDSEYFLECSLSFYKGSKSKLFYYLCKYFNIEANEDNLEYFEELLNNFLAIEDGVWNLEFKKDDIWDDIKLKVPLIIRYFSMEKFEEEIVFEEIDFSEIYFPSYTMQYISDGANASLTTEIILDVENLERFIKYLLNIIKWEKAKSIKGLLWHKN